jgi:hypothetical protein
MLKVKRISIFAIINDVMLDGVIFLFEFSTLWFTIDPLIILTKNHALYKE